MTRQAAKAWAQEVLLEKWSWREWRIFASVRSFKITEIAPMFYYPYIPLMQTPELGPYEPGRFKRVHVTRAGAR